MHQPLRARRQATVQPIRIRVTAGKHGLKKKQRGRPYRRRSAEPRQNVFANQRLGLEQQKRRQKYGAGKIQHRGNIIIVSALRRKHCAPRKARQNFGLARRLEIAAASPQNVRHIKAFRVRTLQSNLRRQVSRFCSARIHSPKIATQTLRAAQRIFCGGCLSRYNTENHERNPRCAQGSSSRTSRHVRRAPLCELELMRG